MARQSVTKLAAGTAVFGLLAVGFAVPAQADETAAAPQVSAAIPDSSSPDAFEPLLPPRPRPEAVPSTRGVRTEEPVTVEQLEKGTKLVIGSHGPAVELVQERLNKLGLLGKVNGKYDKATADLVARFNEKFRGYESKENKVLDAKAWKKLRSESAGRTVPAWCESKKNKTALCVDKHQRIIRLYKKGKLKMTLDARFGRPGERTRTGKFRIFLKRWNDFSTQYKTPMPHSMYFSGGQAIHYSMFFGPDGYNGASHGCVNTRDRKGIQKMWRLTPVGTKIFIYGKDQR